MIAIHPGDDGGETRHDPHIFPAGGGGLKWTKPWGVKTLRDRQKTNINRIDRCN